jgi:PAS domain S-box-containing protein
MGELVEAVRDAATAYRPGDGVRAGPAGEVARREALKADLAGMRRVHDLHARLATETDLRAALEEICAAATELAGTERGCVQLFSDNGERLEMFAFRGYVEQDPFIRYFMHEGSKPACDVARRDRRRLEIKDVETFAPLAGTPDHEVALAAGIRATNSTLMISRAGELVGVLSVQFGRTHRASEQQLQRLDLLAWTAADFVERHLAIAALRESEEHCRMLVENVGGHAVFMLDAEGFVTEWTGSAQRVKGYAPEEVIGRHVSVFYAPEEIEAGDPGRELAEPLREGRAEREAWRGGKDGERIWVNEVATAVRDGGGNLVGFTKISRDLTERRELEAERELSRTRELTALVEAAERERISRELHDRVAHHMGVAHQSLELYAALREAAPERAAEKLALARETTRVALDQIRALSAELKRLRDQELEVGIEAALQALAETTVPEGIALDVSISGDESAVPEPVGVQIYLPMRRAIRNAVRHSGCGRIGARLEILDGEVRGTVEGDGMVFDPEAVGRATPSWGVGLRSMRERAEMLGGTLRLNSAPGTGTRAEVRVPLDGRR